MTTPDSPQTGAARVNRRLRTASSALLGTVAILGLLTSLIALWAHSVLFDSATVGRAVDEALAEPEVTDELATRLTLIAFEAADVETRLTQLLPDGFDALVPALVGGAQTAVEGRLAELLADDTTRAVLVQSVEIAHERLMRLLEGDGLLDGVTVDDGQVRVNLLPLATFGLEAVRDLGYLGDVEVPRLRADGDPVEQIAVLEAAFDRDLPDDFGQLVVYESESLASAGATLDAAQRGLVLVKRALAVVIATTVIAFVCCIAVANRRWRTALLLSLGSVAVLLVARSIVEQIVDEAPAVALDPAGRAAIAAVLVPLTSGLLLLLRVTALVGTVAAAVAFWRSDHRLSVALRRRLGATRAGIITFATDHRDVSALLAFALAVAVLVIAGIGLASTIAAAVLIVAGAVLGSAGERPDRTDVR